MLNSTKHESHPAHKLITIKWHLKISEQDFHTQLDDF